MLKKAMSGYKYSVKADNVITFAWFLLNSGARYVRLDGKACFIVRAYYLLISQQKRDHIVEIITSCYISSEQQQTLYDAASGKYTF
jgi:hypothetical protein